MLLQASKLQINYGEETYNRGKELLAKRKKKGNITDSLFSVEVERHMECSFGVIWGNQWYGRPRFTVDTKPYGLVVT